MNLESAERSIRHGSVAGFILAVVTLAIVAIATATDRGGDLRIWNDPWNLLDVVLIVALSVAISGKSRAAAILMLVYYIFARIYISIELGRATGIAVGLVFVYFFARSVQGTFVYHRIRREQDPSYRPTRRWAYFVWPPVAILVGLLGLGLLVVPTDVRSGTEVRRGHLELLHSEGILMPDEKVILFYSAGFLSILEDGNLLTDSRVISYETVDRQLTVTSVEYSQIADVSLESLGSFLEDARILVTTVAGEQLLLLASTEGGGDKTFFNELQQRWKAATE